MTINQNDILITDSLMILNKALYRPKSDFTQDVENPKIADMRYHNYIQRYIATVKSVYDERRFLMNKPTTASQMLGTMVMGPIA